MKNTQIVRIAVGILLFFSGIALGGITYATGSNHIYIWLGAIGAVLGLIIVASPKVWADAFTSLLNS